MNKFALNALRKRLLTRLRTGRVGEQILEFLLPNKEFGKNFTIGHITTVPGTSSATVVGSGLTPEFQSLGLGKKLYGEMTRRSPEQLLLSDGNVSPSATRVWEGMIRRRPTLTQLNPGWKWDPKLETFVQESGPQYSRTSPTFSATLPPKAAIKQSAVIERSGDPGLYLRLHREVSVSHLDTAFKLGAAQAQHDFQAELHKSGQFGDLVPSSRGQDPGQTIGQPALTRSGPSPMGGGLGGRSAGTPPTPTAVAGVQRPGTTQPSNALASLGMGQRGQVANTPTGRGAPQASPAVAAGPINYPGAGGGGGGTAVARAPAAVPAAGGTPNFPGMSQFFSGAKPAAPAGLKRPSWA